MFAPKILLLATLVLASPALAQDAPPAPPPPDSTVVPEVETPAPAPAATAPAPAAAPAAAPAVTGDTTFALPAVFTLRSRAEIDAEQRHMTDVVTASLNHVSGDKASASRQQGQIDIKKGEIKDINREIDAAKKEKREGDRKKFEAQKKKLEAQQRYLEKLRDWHNAEASFRQSYADYAQARIEEGKAEIKMLDLGDLSTPAARQRVEVRNAAARVLAAIKTRADKGAALASAERNAVDKRKAVLEAYTTMSNS